MPTFLPESIYDAANLLLTFRANRHVLEYYRMKEDIQMKPKYPQENEPFWITQIHPWQ